MEILAVGLGWARGEVCRFQHSNGPESRHCLISSWSSIFTQGVTGKIVPGITHKTPLSPRQGAPRKVQYQNKENR